MDKPWKPHRQIGESDSEDDENSSAGDVVTRKFSSRNHRKRSKQSQTSHHHRHRHQRSRGKVQLSSPSSSVKLHVYQQTPQGRIHVLFKEVPLPINSDDNEKVEFDKWIPLDLTSVVNEWLQKDEQSLSIDLYCENCAQHGLRIVNQSPDDDDLGSTRNNPTLNIIGSVVRTKRRTGVPQRKKVEKLGEIKDYTVTKPKKTFCKQKGEKRCCRHRWVIDFKELGGYDYIIEPRKFDAGYCDGTCAFRENVANNHAFFQSLARNHSQHSHVPNVCCAPTRFVDMEILHVDELDHTKLKVTTMKKMKAMRCSCT